MNKLIITGIGSRETPKEICDEMTKIGQWAKENGHIIRSGHADGADISFELGAQENCYAFLPWKGFNKNLQSKANLIVVEPHNDLIEIVKKYHPNPDALNYGSIKLMCRNVQQIMGVNGLYEPDNQSDLVVCWTKSGGLSGGTAFAMRIAMDLKIPIINMFDQEYNTAEKVIEYIKHKIYIKEQLLKMKTEWSMTQEEIDEIWD